MNSKNQFNNEMSDHKEMDRITKYMQENKLSVIKLSQSIDPTSDANLTQYNAFMTLSDDGLSLEIYTKKPVPKQKESTVNQRCETEDINQDDLEQLRQNKEKEAYQLEQIKLKK